MKNSKRLMKRQRMMALIIGLALMLSLSAVGCSNSSGGGAPAPNLALDKADFDFGNVTLGNSATLQVTVSNTGGAALTVSDYALSGDTSFVIDASDCGASPYTIAAGGECLVVATFTPDTVGAHSATLEISSNDADTPAATVTLAGTGTAVAELTVNLNQILADCPGITAYVTVTDQDGFAVTGLQAGDFLVTENSGAIGPVAVDFAENAALPMAAAIVMDYSGSVTDDPNFVASMEAGATDFVNQMGTSDQGEIVKFATTVEVTQALTADKAALAAAIAQVPNVGVWTALYDAIYQGIQDAAAAAATHRRAVIVLTDGVDKGDDSGSPGSVQMEADVIALAQAEGVPIFTIGVGNLVDPAVLQSLADESGGQYFAAPTTDRIRTIYAQLSEILNNQYILTYNSALAGMDVQVQVTVPVDVPQPGVLGGVSLPLTYTSACP